MPESRILERFGFNEDVEQVWGEMDILDSEQEWIVRLGGATAAAAEDARYWLCFVCVAAEALHRLSETTTRTEPSTFNNMVCVDLKDLVDAADKKHVALPALRAETIYHVDFL